MGSIRGRQPASQMKYAGHGVLKAVKANKMQIAHDPMPELQWPAMTMWFGLRDALPQDIRVGGQRALRDDAVGSKTVGNRQD